MVKKYLEQGEVGLENKKNLVIHYLNIWTKTIIRYWKTRIWKYEVKNREWAIKKGYIVEGDGQVVIFNGSKNKNSK